MKIQFVYASLTRMMRWWRNLSDALFFDNQSRGLLEGSVCLNILECVSQPVSRISIQLTRYSFFFCFLLVGFPIGAKPIEGYCLSKVKPDTAHYHIEPKRRQEESFFEKYLETVPIPFMAHGKNYHLAVQGNGIDLIDDEHNKKLGSASVYQEVFLGDERRLFDVKLTKNGLIFVNGQYQDYVAQVDINADPPSLSKGIELSELTNIECRVPILNWFSPMCDAVKGTYSSVLERVFIFPRRFFGLLSLTGFEIVNGNEARLLPPELQGQLSFREVPELKGVIFKGTKGEALFYDGTKVTSLLDVNRYGGHIDWNVITTDRKRSFLVISSTSKKTFLIEIKPDLTTKSKLWIKEIASTGSIPFKPLLSPLTFWSGSRSIGVESDDAVYPVIVIATSKPSHHILYSPHDGDPFSYLEVDRGLVFKILDITTGKKSDYYFVVPISPTTQCLAILDPEKPIELNIDN
jgi:hypothetical protein